MNQSRRKLLNAVLFFVGKARKVNTTKLCKLLYFFDFTIARQTGYPAIGLRYHAFERGPVPWDFWAEIKGGKVPDDFRGKVRINRLEKDTNPDYVEFRFIAAERPDMRVFTPRERRVLEHLAEVFRDATAADMSEITHLKNTPWEKTYSEQGRHAPIDYRLAFDKNSPCPPEHAAGRLDEFFAVLDNFQVAPIR